MIAPNFLIIVLIYMKIQEGLTEEETAKNEPDESERMQVKIVFEYIS